MESTVPFLRKHSAFSLFPQLRVVALSWSLVTLPEGSSVPCELPRLCSASHPSL